MQKLLSVLGEIVFTTAKETRVLLKERLAYSTAQNSAQDTADISFTTITIFSSSRELGEARGQIGPHWVWREDRRDSATILLCLFSAYKIPEGNLQESLAVFIQHCLLNILDLRVKGAL